MEQKLEKLYYECICELDTIGIYMRDKNIIGEIDIKISKRNNQRYGCCKQEKPDLYSKYIERIGNKRIVRYQKFQIHHIEISPWVMELEDNIIKNTIIHEMIHCIPNCNNHGKEFKKYASYINSKLGYDISRVGNKQADFKTSKLEYKEEESYNYKIECKKCGQEFYRKRLDKNFTMKYRCGNCRGKFIVIELKK